MQAIDHNTYADYVAYTKGRGYSVIPQDLYDALKKQHNEMFENFSRDLMLFAQLDENQNKDGSVNWNFVDSDMYTKWSVMLDGELYTEYFEKAADKFEETA